MTGEQLALLCKAQVGAAYVWGGLGYTLTEARLSQLKRLYPAHYTPAYLAKARALLGKNAFDCAGLLKHFLWGNTGDGVLRLYGVNGVPDTTANGLLTLCAEQGSVEALPELPGLLLHQEGHVGVYAGAGRAIEARGIEWGVVETQVAGRGWKRWGKLPGVDYAPPAGVISWEALFGRLRAEGVTNIAI